MQAKAFLVMYFTVPIKLNKYLSLLPEQKADNQLNHGVFYLLFVSMKTSRLERKQT